MRLQPALCLQNHLWSWTSTSADRLLPLLFRDPGPCYVPSPLVSQRQCPAASGAAAAVAAAAAEAAAVATPLLLLPVLLMPLLLQLSLTPGR